MKSHPKIRQLQGPDSDNYEVTMDFLKKNMLPESNIKKTDSSNQVDQELLKKYIMYAKRMVHPKLNEIDREKVTQFYADIRRESSVVGGIPIAVRHIESVLRMSEAYAKIHLRDYVRAEDIDFAIAMLVNSFMQSQKETVKRVLSKKFAKYLNKRTGENENFSLLIHQLDKYCKHLILMKKMSMGVEDVETVTIDFPVSQWKHELGTAFDATTVDEFLKSNTFRKEYKIENGSIKCTKTM